ncbi:MAG TPA: hypothetical protein VJQ07_10950 [Gaiellaceae bacterium]|nr:hypothetical protein [Gaiellaceae bacterium]
MSDANQDARPIVAAVEPQTARMVGDTAARLARELDAPLVFVTSRCGGSCLGRHSPD